MMKNIKDRKNYFYRALNCLDELLKSLVISEQMGYLPETLTNKIKKEISDLNRLIFKRIKHRQQVFS